MKKLFIIAAFLFLFFSYPAFAKVSVFSSPENSLNALAYFLDGTGQSMDIATYTFTDKRLASRLIEFEQKEIEVRILVDDSPVGGIPDKDLLCFLNKNGIEVFLWKGETGRNYMHAKYIVKDKKELLVSTENFGEGGYPEQKGNRGWGLTTDNKNSIEDFEGIFEKDLKKSKKIACENTKEVKLEELKKEAYNPKEFEAETETLFAPDNAVEKIIEFVGSARKKLYIEQMYIYKDWKDKLNPFLEAAIERAREGVEVKILLDSSFGDEKNDETVDYIKNISRKENISIEAKLIELKGTQLKTVHAKGIIADDRILVSSVNWNENSPTKNRESGIISEDRGDYFSEIFLKDWSPENGVTGNALAETETETKNMYIEIIVFFCVVGGAGLLVRLKKN